MQELVARADIVSIHVPLLETTKHMIDKNMLKMMKKNAVIINTARGGIINEADLYDSLKNGDILGAGLDVFEKEPVSKDYPLVMLPNVVASSHCAGNSIDNSVTMGKLCAGNIMKIARGEKIVKPTLVNKEFLK